jgi:transposase-like protein
MGSARPTAPGVAGPAADSTEGWWRSVPDEVLADLIRAHGRETGARIYLEELRWPAGVSCLRCSSLRVGWLDARQKYYCRDCGYQFRVTIGTVFHDSHVPLETWLIALQLILTSERGFPANRLYGVLGGSYKTAWFIGHRIRAAMSQSLIESGMPVALARAVERAEAATAIAPVGRAGEGWLLVKKLVAGDYHRPSAEHLTAYWNESRWRAANLDNEHVFRETVRALLATGPLPYRQLVGSSSPSAGRGDPPAS